MSDTDSRIRALILAYEDLDAEDRLRADEFLSRNPEFRLQLDRLQQLEAWARHPIPLGEGEALPEFNLSVEEEQQLARSLEALLKRLGLEKGASGTGFFASPGPSSAPGSAGPAAAERSSIRRFRRSWIPLALAASIALVVWAPWSDRNPVRFRDATVVAVDTAAGTTRGAENADSWNSGEAFALSFRLDTSAGVIVYHVDPSGRVNLVVPGSTAEPIPYFESGSTHRIPSAMAEEQWVLGGETGRESFFLVAINDPELDLGGLDERIRDRLDGIVNRNQIMDALRSLLEEDSGPVQLIEFDHLP